MFTEEILIYYRISYPTLLNKLFKLFIIKLVVKKDADKNT